MPTFDNALILHDLPIMQSSYQYNNAFKYQNPKIQIHRNRNRNSTKKTQLCPVFPLIKVCIQRVWCVPVLEKITSLQRYRV